MEVNLLDKLKEAPNGLELYSTVHGKVRFVKIDNSKLYPIECLNSDHSLCYFTTDGRLYTHLDGECVLFPLKEQRDWSKFKIDILPIDTPVMVSDDKIDWKLRYYAGDGCVWFGGEKSGSNPAKIFYEYIIKYTDFKL